MNYYNIDAFICVKTEKLISASSENLHKLKGIAYQTLAGDSLILLYQISMQRQLNISSFSLFIIILTLGSLSLSSSFTIQLQKWVSMLPSHWKDYISLAGTYSLLSLLFNYFYALVNFEVKSILFKILLYFMYTLTASFWLAETKSSKFLFNGIINRSSRLEINFKAKTQLVALCVVSSLACGLPSVVLIQSSSDIILQESQELLIRVVVIVELSFLYTLLDESVKKYNACQKLYSDILKKFDVDIIEIDNYKFKSSCKSSKSLHSIVGEHGIDFLLEVMKEPYLDSSSNIDSPSSESKSRTSKVIDYESEVQILDQIVKSRFWFEYIGTYLFKESIVELYGKRSKHSNYYSLILKDRSWIYLKGQNKINSLKIAKYLHDFKSPILLINDIVDKLNKIITQHDQGQKEKQGLVAVTEYMGELIDKVNQFTISENNFAIKSNNKSQTSLVKIKSVNLRKMINSIEMFFQAKLNFGSLNNCDCVKFVVTVDDRLPSDILTNEVNFKQVIHNLLSNSFKFTLNGLIRLKLEMTIDYKLLVEVMDTGLGIKPETISKLFTPYNTFSVDSNYYKSSGLGIIIVNDILKSFGSQLSIKQLRQGSSFSYIIDCLPKELQIRVDEVFTEDIPEEPNVYLKPQMQYHLLSRDAIALSTNLQATPKSAQSHYKSNINEQSYLSLVSKKSKHEATHQFAILVLEDEKIAANAVTKLFRKYAQSLNNDFEFEITHALNPIVGLDKIYQLMTMQNKFFDLIITDDSMPLISGKQFAYIFKNILEKNHLNSVDIVLLSGNTYSGYSDLPDIKLVIPKPLRLEDVERIVESCLIRKLEL